MVVLCIGSLTKDHVSNKRDWARSCLLVKLPYKQLLGIYRVFKSDLLIVILYSLEATGQKFLNFQCMSMTCYHFVMPNFHIEYLIVESLRNIELTTDSEAKSEYLYHFRFISFKEKHSR